jgi:RHS repeat-associated protein
VTGDHLHYITDHLGTVLALAEDGGNVVQEYTYDEFGALLSESNPALYQPFSFTGRERELESGLYNYRTRFYDAGIGRFLSADPSGLATGENFYLYVGNNPINRIDPLGLAGWSYWIARGYFTGGAMAVTAGFAMGVFGGPLIGAGALWVVAGVVISSGASCAAGAGAAKDVGRKVVVKGMTGQVLFRLLDLDVARGVKSIWERIRNPAAYAAKRAGGGDGSGDGSGGGSGGGPCPGGSGGGGPGGGGPGSCDL